MKKILFGQDARNALKKGIDTATKAIACTLGPTGRNAVIGRLDIPPLITNDGATIARSIELDDEIENQGSWMVKEVTALTDKKAGDGTTTTAVLMQKIIEDAFALMKDDDSLISSRVDVIKLKKQIDESCEIVVKLLQTKARQITESDIYNVALVSAEYEWLARIIADIYIKIGKDGFISTEESHKTSYEIFKGIELEAGYHSEYYVNNDKRECVIETPYILVTNQKLEATAIVPLIEELVAKDVKEVIFIAPDFTRDLLNRLTTTKVKAGFTAVALRLPTFEKNDLLLDIATLTQATFLDKNTFTTYESFAKAVKVSALGRAERAIVGESKTMIIGGEGDTAERVKEIKKLHEESQSEFDKNTYEKRIAFLGGGIAVIRIGGSSDTERSYFKLKAEDAINSVQVALQEGVVKGGGLVLKEIAEEIPVNILTNALKAPYEQIQKNAGGIEIGDSIIDPVKVTISAVKSACSIAGVVITTETVSAYKRDEPRTKNHDTQN